MKEGGVRISSGGRGGAAINAGPARVSAGVMSRGSEGSPLRSVIASPARVGGLPRMRTFSPGVDGKVAFDATKVPTFSAGRPDVSNVSLRKTSQGAERPMISLKKSEKVAPKVSLTKSEEKATNPLQRRVIPAVRFAPFPMPKDTSARDGGSRVDMTPRKSDISPARNLAQEQDIMQARKVAVSLTKLGVPERNAQQQIDRIIQRRDSEIRPQRYTEVLPKNAVQQPERFAAKVARTERITTIRKELQQLEISKQSDTEAIQKLGLVSVVQEATNITVEDSAAEKSYARMQIGKQEIYAREDEEAMLLVLLQRQKKQKEKRKSVFAFIEDSLAQKGRETMIQFAAIQAFFGGMFTGKSEVQPISGADLLKTIPEHPSKDVVGKLAQETGQSHGGSFGVFRALIGKMPLVKSVGEVMDYTKSVLSSVKPVERVQRETQTTVGSDDIYRELTGKETNKDEFALAS